MRDIIRRLIRLLRIIWRQRSRPSPSLESITRKRLAALDRRHDLELAAFAFEMAVQPPQQKFICAPDPKLETVTITQRTPAHLVCVLPALNLPWNDLTKGSLFRPTETPPSITRIDYLLLKNAVIELVYGRKFRYGMTAYEISCGIGKTAREQKDVERAMTELMAVDGSLETGNLGSERAYYFHRDPL